jgi:steroid delta-isomerase-like uncharacterized protein
MSTETNKWTARAFLESFDKGDFDAWRAARAPDMVAHLNGGDPAMSAEEFEGMARMFAEAFANGRHIIQGQVAEGDWVATRLTWTAVHVGTFNGIPASQRPVRIDGGAYDRFVDGKIAEHRAHFDVMALMTQIGAIPAAA